MTGSERVGNDQRVGDETMRLGQITEFCTGLLNALEHFDELISPLALYASADLMADGQFAAANWQSNRRSGTAALNPISRRMAAQPTSTGLIRTSGSQCLTSVQPVYA